MDKNNNQAKVALSNITQIHQEYKTSFLILKIVRLLQKKDPDKNMANLNKGLDTLSGDLTEKVLQQKTHNLPFKLGAITNMKNIKKDPSKEDPQENRIYVEGFIELMESELLGLIEISKERIDIQKFEKRANGIVRSHFS